MRLFDAFRGLVATFFELTDPRCFLRDLKVVGFCEDYFTIALGAVLLELLALLEAL